MFIEDAMYRYPERCPHCNNILNSEGICPSCQYRSILTIESEDGIRESKPVQFADEQVTEIAKGALSIRLTDHAVRKIHSLKFNNYRLALFAEDEKKRNRDAAERWIKTYLYGKVFRVYIYNAGKGTGGDELISIRIATDVRTDSNVAILNETNNRTLVLTGAIQQTDSFSYRANRRRRLLVTDVTCEDLEVGRFDQTMSVPVDLMFTENSRDYEFDEELLTWVRVLPDSDFRKDQIREKISHWSAYLEIQERNLPDSQYKVTYRYFRPGSKKDEYYFFLEDSPSLPWKQIERSIGGNIHLLTSAERLSEVDGYPFEFNGEVEKGEQAIRLGTLDDLDKSKKKLTITLDARLASRIDAETYQLPGTGILVYKNEGERIAIERMKWGLTRLENGQSENPYLGDFIFDSRQARSIQEGDRTTLSRDDFLNQEIFGNDEQKKAVEGALSAKDLYLIQGPPGTGKTTVIAEICYQMARQGGRTLIASQTNLAVDNVLSRLVHDKAIRSLRLGKAERVEEEGLPFIEERVIDTWLTKTSQARRNQLEQERSRLNELKELLKYKQRIFQCLHVLRSNNREIKRAERELEEYERKIKAEEGEIARIKSTLGQTEKLQDELRFISNLDESKAYLALSAWTDRLPANLQSVVTQFVRDTLQDLDTQLRSNFPVSDALHKLPERKPLVRAISQLHTARAELQSDRKQNARFLHCLSYVMFRSMQLADVLRELNWAQWRLAEYKDAYKAISIYAAESLVNDSNLFSTQETAFSRRIEELERTIEKAQENRRILLSHVRNGLQLCEKIYPGIMNHELPDHPNMINVDLAAIDEWEKYLKSAIDTFSRRGKVLSQIFDALAPNLFIEKVAKELWRAQEDIRHTLSDLEKMSAIYSKQAEEITGQLRILKHQLQKEQRWWDQFTENPPRALSSYQFKSFLDNDEEFKRFHQESQEWEREEAVLQNYFDRYESFTLEWVERLDARNEQDMAELRQIYVDNANVIGITCLQAGARDFLQEYRNFDCVIVDEVTKATPVELLLPLLKGKKVILVGDHKQLPPMMDQNSFAELAELIKMPESKLRYIKRALFEDLYENGPDSLKTMLKVQYRMHPEIMNAINQFYDHELICGIENPDTKCDHGLDISPWLMRENHLLWVDFPLHPSYSEKSDRNKSYYNEAEIKTVCEIVNQIDSYMGRMKGTGGKKEIGIITFYAAQVERLSNELKKRSYDHINLRVGTVDRFQGMERPIIIASLVRNNNQRDIGFAKEIERINVAFSRAQELLVIVGCATLFAQEAKGNQGKAVQAYSRVYDLALKYGTAIRADRLLSV
jgi:superfamily I DNA and/or RNA helicase